MWAWIPDDWDTPFVPTPFLLTQYLSFHQAVVKDVKDKWGVQRVRCECPELLGTGKENWTPWLQMVGNAIGGGQQTDGDQGIWWPVQPQQTVYVAFLAGHPLALFAIPGPPYQTDQKSGTDRNKQLTPLEAKIAAKDDPREAARLKIFKDETGHTLLMDARGKREKLALVDFAGAGLFMSCPGKIEDEKEQEEEESKPRAGERRGTRMVVTGTAKKPGELLRDGIYLMGLFDLNGSGIVKYATDNQGLVAGFAKTPDGEIGASWLADAKNKRLFLTAGDMQIQILGKKNKIAVTRQIIMEVEKVDVESVIGAMTGALGQEFQDVSGG